MLFAFKKQKAVRRGRFRAKRPPRTTQAHGLPPWTGETLDGAAFARRLSGALLGPLEMTVDGEPLVCDGRVAFWGRGGLVTPTHNALLDGLFPHGDPGPWTRGLLENFAKPVATAVAWTSECGQQDHLGLLTSPASPDFGDASGFVWGFGLPPIGHQTSVRLCHTNAGGLLAAEIFFEDRGKGLRRWGDPFAIVLGFLDKSGTWRRAAETRDLWYGKVFCDAANGTGWRLVLVHRWTTHRPGEWNPLERLADRDKDVRHPSELRVVSVFFGWVSLVFRRVPDADGVAAFACRRYTGPRFGLMNRTAESPAFYYDAELSRALSSMIPYGQPFFALRMATREAGQKRQAATLTSMLQCVSCGGRSYGVCRVVLGESSPLPPIVPADRVPPVVAQLTEEQAQSSFAVQIQCASTEPASWLTVWFYERTVA